MSYNEKEREKCARVEQESIKWFLNSKKENGQNIVCSQSPSIYSSFDNFLNSGSTEYIIEVKVRLDYTGSQIDGYGGAFFEYNKLAGMINYKEEHGHNHPILYFNFFKDELRIYAIKDDPTEYTWYQKRLPKDSYDKFLIWKWVTDLQKKDLIEIIKYK